MNTRPREIWFDGRVVPLERQDIWGLVNNSPIKKVVVTMDQWWNGHYPYKTEFVVEVQDEKDLKEVKSGVIVMSCRQELLRSARRQGLKACLFASIEGGESLEQSWKDAAEFDYAVVDFDLPTNIPLELIIVRLQESTTVLLRQVTTYQDAEIAFGVLERGSDGVLFSGQSVEDISKLAGLLSRGERGRFELQPLTVTEVRHVGMGSRACIDTTDFMSQEEGMLVGSTSSGGIFVCSETHFLPYMNLRPFRVNAGAVHSYIWMPNDAAEYISDLAAGSKVQCVDICGGARELTVGRVKIEMRPLLLIKGEAAGSDLNVIVQDDWHIRLMGVDGKPRNASTIRPGDELLAHVCEPGRHVGIKVSEMIIEK
ncbi:MAG: 3-dehydroquinate synthase [Ammonifex sp.]|jgi:3-dehydroquinate synthase II/3-amino-4-hydroxybenzoic acid synthase|nr:MAG: 3-dehydroquinate synthase [Ammonifex sp.]